MLVVASVLFLIGSLSFLDGDRYVFVSWMVVLGSLGFLGHALPDALAERSSSD
jgi:hypothetical protein